MCVFSPGRPPMKVLDWDSSIGTSVSSLRPGCPSTSSTVWLPEIVTWISWLSPSHSGAGELAMMTSPTDTRTNWRYTKGQFSNQAHRIILHLFVSNFTKYSHLATRLCRGDSRPERWKEGLCPGEPVPTALRCQKLDAGWTEHSGSVILKGREQEERGSQTLSTNKSQTADNTTHCVDERPVGQVVQQPLTD